MRKLSEHRTNAGHLEHQPLYRRISLAGICGQQAPCFLGQIHKDRPRFPYGKGYAPRTIGIADDRDFLVRIEERELRGVLLAHEAINRVMPIGHSQFLERNDYLVDVRAAYSPKIYHFILLNSRGACVRRVARFAATHRDDYRAPLPTGTSTRTRCHSAPD